MAANDDNGPLRLPWNNLKRKISRDAGRDIAKKIKRERLQLLLDDSFSSSADSEVESAGFEEVLPSDDGGSGSDNSNSSNSWCDSIASSMCVDDVGVKSGGNSGNVNGDGDSVRSYSGEHGDNDSVRTGSVNGEHGDSDSVRSDYVNDEYGDSDSGRSDGVGGEHGDGGGGDSGDGDGDSGGDSSFSNSSSSDESEDSAVNEIAFADEDEREQFTIEVIRQWSTSGGILSHRKIDGLLLGLSPAFPHMPLSHKTLCKPDRDIVILDLPSGAKLWYKSIRANLDAMNLTDYLAVHGDVTLDINIDGLPLFKSSKLKFWPILGKLVGSKNEPFIIAVHFGKRNPTVDDLLEDYVIEVQSLLENGYEVNGVSYPFIIGNYVLDAPARSLVKCIIGHQGYASCEKCSVWGEWRDSRMTYVDLDSPLRTDQSFTARDQPHHHSGDSPLEPFTRMVSQFRLDSMHLLFEGVVKRLLGFWLKVLGVWKLHPDIVEMISTLLRSLVDSCPTDFNRNPRGLDEYAHFKATEFRRLVLYDGVLVFKDLIDENVYKNFLLLPGPDLGAVAPQAK